MLRALCLIWLALGFAASGTAFEVPLTPVSPGIMKEADLLPEARVTLNLIKSGGPFPHKRDGIVFGNHERRLPRARNGFYREYTVPTPGARNRGARRLICGGELPLQPQVCYYTADHYRTFHRIQR